MSKKDNKENVYGLASVQAVKIYTTEEIEERKRNKEKHMSIFQWVTKVNEARAIRQTEWDQPVDYLENGYDKDHTQILTV